MVAAEVWEQRGSRGSRVPGNGETMDGRRREDGRTEEEEEEEYYAR